MCDSENCNCGGTSLKVEGFIVPCILFLLKEKPAHGYEIMEKLSSLAFLDSIPDPSVVYRHLRNLEEEGKVESELVPGSGGPARKVYSMTSGGEDYLRMWILKIRRRKGSLETFLKVFEETYPQG